MVTGSLIMVTTNNVNRSSCIIVGAGIGGLAAAGALAPLFKSITIIDKDPLPSYPTSRKSTIQSNHLHSLLIAGQLLLEKFYPGITEELNNAGGVVLRAGIDQQIYEFGTWMPKRDLGMNISAQSRSLLEFVLRNRTSRLSNVNILDSTKVENFLIEKNKVTGVVLSANHENKKTILADVIVDASGLSGNLSAKLNQLCPEIESKKETVNSRIVYVTAFIKKPKKWQNHKENILIVAEPQQTCGGALLDIEKDTWVVSLNGRNGVVPPTTTDEWKKFAKQLASPAIWERIKNCENLGKLRKFNKPLSYFRRFDKVHNLPSGYFPLGDTINSLNPTFGQGMALAIGHADRLREVFLNDSNIDQQKQYLKSVTKWSQRSWRQTVAYESMFAVSDESARNKFQILQTLVLNKHKQAIGNADTHLQLFKQAQMLD